MRIPYALQGIFFAPVVIGLLFVLKAFCPGSAGNACFADWFATPVFLPLIAVYKMFGEVPLPNFQEFLFILLYWALVGLLLGLVVDIMKHKAEPTPLAAARMTFQANVPRPVPPPVTPYIKPSTPLQKPPLNMLDRPEFKN